MQGFVPRGKVSICEDEARLTRTGTFRGHLQWKGTKNEL